MPFALGMIETKGLIGAIEAADAACKAANVKLISSEKVKGALINIKIIGEVAAVKSAVDAGATAAKRLCNLVSAHVIPNPIDELEPYLTDITIQTANKQAETVSKKIAKKDSNSIDAPLISQNENVLHDIKDINNEEDIAISSIPENQEQISLDYSTFAESSEDELLDELESMKVHELRKMARGIPNLGIYGREISRANKETLIQEILKVHNENK
jgi:microcompartment protein CcmL/EutN